MGRWLEVDEGGGGVDDDGEMTMKTNARTQICIGRVSDQRDGMCAECWIPDTPKAHKLLGRSLSGIKRPSLPTTNINSFSLLCQF